jgi:calmodulin-lysine N-methyltransferase
VKCNPDDSQQLSYQYTSGTSNRDVTVKVKLLPQIFNIDDISGFNNTGNICIWPSEEVMAYFCLENMSLFQGRSICELGAGMTGLAGMMIAATQTANHVLLTDGNEKSVANLSAIIHLNELSLNTSASVLCWNASRIDQEYKTFKQEFDFILCADCLFFTQVHDDLIATLQYILKPNGSVFIFAPERSGTFDLFCQKACKYFNIEIKNYYHKLIEDKHFHLMQTNKHYDPRIHYPKCAILKFIEK